MAAVSLLIAAAVGLISIAASTGASIYSANKQAEGQKEANLQNLKLYQAEMDYNSAEAQKNRDFQLMMSNTAHQREVADLKAAGLNPWLSVGGAGAPVAAGSSASSSAPNMQNTAIDLSDVASSLNSIKDLALISALGYKWGKK